MIIFGYQTHLLSPINCLRKLLTIHGAPAYECMCAYESSHSSRLAPGPTVTRPGQIPHPGAQALRLVTANFDRRLFEKKKVKRFAFYSSQPLQRCLCEEWRCMFAKTGQTFPKKTERELLAEDVSAVVSQFSAWWRWLHIIHIMYISHFLLSDL